MKYSIIMFFVFLCYSSAAYTMQVDGMMVHSLSISEETAIPLNPIVEGRTYGEYVVEGIEYTGAQPGKYTFHVEYPTADQVELRKDGSPVVTSNYIWWTTVSADDATQFYTFYFPGYFSITVRKAGTGTMNLYAMNHSIFNGIESLVIEEKKLSPERPAAPTLSGFGSGSGTTDISSQEKVRAEQEARAKAKLEAQERSELEAIAKAELEAKKRAEQEAIAKSELEAKKMAEQEAKAKLELESSSVKALDISPDKLTGSYLGTLLEKPGYQLQPTGYYDHKTGEFNILYFGEFESKEHDVWGPDDSLLVGDRIYVSKAASLNGPLTEWLEKSKIIYKGQAGRTGKYECDDHLVGSPSMIKLNNKFYQVIESYTWVTRVLRMFSHTRGDNWTTTGQTDALGSLPGNDGSYFEDKHFGFAPRYRRKGTHPIYAGEVTYNVNGKTNRFLSKSSVIARKDVHGDWRPLNNGEPIFFLYTKALVGQRKELFQFWSGMFWNSFVTDDPTGEIQGALLDTKLGYIPIEIDGDDMAGVLHNHIRLLTGNSVDTLKPFHGAETNGAIISPQKRNSAQWPHQSVNPLEIFDAHRKYGSGYPTILEREGNIELFFTDDTVAPFSLAPWVVRVTERQIEDGLTWSNSARHPLDVGFSDIKWSERYKRYFAISFDGVRDSQNKLDPLTQHPVLIWSEKNPQKDRAPIFPAGNRYDISLPDDVGAASGGIIGDERGHLIENFPGHVPIHVVFEQFKRADVNINNNVDTHAIDIGHALVFLWD